VRVICSANRLENHSTARSKSHPDVLGPRERARSQLTLESKANRLKTSAATSHATSFHHSPPLHKQAHHACLRRRSVLGSQEQTFHTRHERHQDAHCQLNRRSGVLASTNWCSQAILRECTSLQLCPRVQLSSGENRVTFSGWRPGLLLHQ
jgi:hypothetical protein